MLALKQLSSCFFSPSVLILSSVLLVVLGVFEFISHWSCGGDGFFMAIEISLHQGQNLVDFIYVVFKRLKLK